MKRPAPVSCAFLDVGGVLLTDGWDRNARRRAARHFGLSWAQIEERHHLAFESYEEGRLTLDEYLDLVIFDRKRGFTRAQFRRFMFAQSGPHPQMIAVAMQLKRTHGLKIAIVSNEGRELNAYRIRRFGLGDIADVFVTSCFVHMRKPDADIFRLALDLVQVPASQVIYIENTPMFIGIAQGLGIRSVLHRDTATTCAALAAWGLPCGPGGR